MNVARSSCVRAEREVSKTNQPSTIRISEHSDVVEKEDGELRVVLVTTIDDGLKKEGLLREVVRAVNNMRKEQGLTREDRVVLSYKTDDALLASVFTDFADELKASVLADDVVVDSSTDAQDTIQIDGRGLQISLQKIK
jgi:isoleucyl-tRNA synthetase